MYVQIPVAIFYFVLGVVSAFILAAIIGIQANKKGKK